MNIPGYEGSLRTDVPTLAEILKGKIKCNIPVDGDIEKRTIKGKIFGGGPEMKIRTLNGDLSITSDAEQMEPIDELESDEPQPVPEDLPTEPTVPYALAMKTLNTPMVDGKLNDECWKSADIIQNN